MAKNDNKGRSKSEARHTRLPHVMTGSAAWLSLSGNAIKVLIALQRLDRGGDNGNIYLSVRLAETSTGLSRNTVAKALAELTERGFVAVVAPGHFAVKGGPATRWRLTFVPSPATHQQATNEWQRWSASPENSPAPCGRRNKTRSQFLTPAVAEIATPCWNVPDAVSETKPATAGTPLVPVEPSVSEIATQVVYQAQGAIRDSVSGLEQEAAWNGLAAVPEAGVVDLRVRLAAHLQQCPPGEQSRLAREAAIPAATLSRFKNGGPLSPDHWVRLGLALQRPAARRAA